MERVVSISPEDASQYANDLWDLYGPGLSPVLDVNLPPALHAGFKVFFDDLDLAGVTPGVPEWVMDVYAVQNAIIAAYYHQRRIADIETVVLDALSGAVASIPRLPVRSNTTLRTMTLSFEYQAFLFAYRRSFEYLSAGICGAFNVAAPKYIRDTAKMLATAESRYQPWVEPMAAQIVEVARRFQRTLAEDSPRNRTAHRRPVEAGNMRIWLDPGAEPRIGLEEGGEELPMKDVPIATGDSLAVILAHQLLALEGAVFELLALLPRPAHLLDVVRIR